MVCLFVVCLLVWLPVVCFGVWCLLCCLFASVGFGFLFGVCVLLRVGFSPGFLVGLNYFWFDCLCLIARVGVAC